MKILRNKLLFLSPLFLPLSRSLLIHYCHAAPLHSLKVGCSQKILSRWNNDFSVFVWHFSRVQQTLAWLRDEDALSFWMLGMGTQSMVLAAPIDAVSGAAHYLIGCCCSLRWGNVTKMAAMKWTAFISRVLPLPAISRWATCVPCRWLYDCWSRKGLWGGSRLLPGVRWLCSQDFVERSRISCQCQHTGTFFSFASAWLTHI